MILREENGIPFYQFPHLAAFKELRHAVYTRRGGVSRDPYRSLNISFGLGDEARSVHQNRERLSRCLGQGELVFIRQVHGSRVAVVDGGRVLGEGRMPPADATVTAHPGRLLAVQVADCQPVLLYDPVCRVAAAVHSGWRGSIVDILGRTVAAMHERFGCRPHNVYAGIGPSLGPCCAQFVNYRTEIPRPLWRYRSAGDLFDFWALSRDQLTSAGVPSGQVTVSGLCTRCRTDLFFSYRGEKTTGRFAAVIGIGASRG